MLFFREKTKNTAPDKKLNKENHINQIPNDEFLSAIKKEAQTANKNIEETVTKYKKQLEHKYSDDIALAQKLSNFARKYQLDKALIAIYKAMKYYNKESNCLNIINMEKKITKNNGNEITKIYFNWNDNDYIISYYEKRSLTPDGGMIAYFSLSEKNEEVFKIDSDIEHDEFGTEYRYSNISRFKKKGEWFKFILNSWEILKTADEKMRASWKYCNADTIKDNFSE